MQTLLNAPLRGTAHPTHAGPNRIQAPGRVCEAVGCTTRLSIYNRVTKCSLHEERRNYIVRGRRRPRAPKPTLRRG